MKDNRNSRYYPARWLYTLGMIQLPFFALFIGLPFYFNDTHFLEWVFFGGFGVFIIISSAYMVFIAKASYIEISDSHLVLKKGFSKKAVKLDEVKRIFLQAGYIVLDSGEVPRFIIPRIFNETKQILQEISFRRGEPVAGGDATRWRS